MAIDPTQLPLLLAGPNLRRVEADLVSVWIATSRPCNVALLLFTGADIPASTTAADDLRAEWVSVPQPTLQIGAHVHVITAMIDLRVPGGNTARSAGPLRADQSFSYDVHIFPVGDTGAPQTLRTLGLLDDPVPLGYDHGELPSFRTCPEQREKLVIVHGSCRQMFATPPLDDDPANDGPFPPPGGWPTEAPTPSKPIPDARAIEFPDEDYPSTPKRDGLFWVDALIDPRGPVQHIASRPHQLFLTGDQIYADDVPPVLLPVLNAVGRVLMGEEDLAADAAGGSFIAATVENFPPAFRQALAVRRGGFTTTDGESQLLTFGEFVAYYLLTWSPALWTLDLWPAEFTAAGLQMPKEWADVFLIEKPDDDVPPPGVPDPRPHTSDYDDLVNALPVPGSPAKNASADQQARWFFGQLCLWLEKKYWSPKLFAWWMKRFRGGLPRVRRTLANVPTYMLADDHEVTDDWYASRQWREKVFTRPLGLEAIRHGLMAYTVMQAWGNDPRRWATGVERELCTEIQRFAVASLRNRRADLETKRHINRLHELLGLPFTPSTPNTVPTFRPLVRFSYQVDGPSHRVLVIDGRTMRRFPERTSQAGGVDYEGPTGLFGDSPMSSAIPPPPPGDTKQTIVVTGVPVLGPEGMELALVPFQRLARQLIQVDAEAWGYDPATYEAMLWALSRYKSVVLLSGDIHVAFSAALDYWSAPTGQAVQTARIVQLVSSGITQDWGATFTPTLKANALTHDIFESVTTALQPSERIGWGTPVREALTPPVSLEKVVKVPAGKVPHPTYRARLKTMRAPVVPTHGWPAGSREDHDPNWAWRLTMMRDDRAESTNTPTLDRRWTPVELVVDPIAPPAAGWHAQAARKMAVGRVFCFQPNVGVVTFEVAGNAWSVRHAIVSELPPLASTGTTPVGPQPYVLHRIPLTPQPAATWTTARPKLHDDGGWGADATEPALEFLLHWLPLIWRKAAGHLDRLWPDLPLNLDEGARDALISRAADRLAGTFRRRVIKELGPYADKTDTELDAIQSAEIAALADRVGPLDVDKEARAVVRPDLARLLDIDAATVDRAAFLDDALLIACSPWVYESESHHIIATVAGILATFRAPVTKQTPVLATLLAGLWDRWRNRTSADFWMKGLGSIPLGVGGLLSAPPRAVIFAFELFKEIFLNIVRDLDPDRTHVPQMLPSELAIATGGAVLNRILSSKRFTIVSGWEPKETPPAPGTRRSDLGNVTLARHTLSLLVHPGARARYEAPAQRFSVTFIPPQPPATPADFPPGALFAAWDGKLNVDGDVGGGVHQRIETSSGGWTRQPWSLALNQPGSLGVPGARTVFSFARPTTWKTGHGVDLRLTPSVGIALGFTSDAAGEHPSVELRLSLNDTEDRIAFVPERDGLLAQLLPTDGISLPIDATVAWDPKNGWRFLGAGQFISPVAKDPAPPSSSTTGPSESEQTTTASTPLNKKLGVLTLLERKIDAGYKASGDGVDVTISVVGTLTINIGPAHIAVAGLGVDAVLHISGDPLHADEPFDVSLHPATPTGLAVSVDADVVSGGGFLQRIESANGEVTWRGGLQLRVVDCFDIAAWGVIESGGGRHWSLLVFLAIRFDPAITLFANFRLVSVGGMVGLHRAMNVDALRDAAMGVQGNLDTLILPEHAEQRFLELLPAVEQFFPPAQDHYVFGLMAEIEWGVSKKVSNARIRAALLLEIGDFKAGLYGTVELGFPTLTVDHIVRIRAGFEAVYDSQAKLARFTLTLTEATLFETVHLTGGAALMIRWGEKDEFAFTLGGFHPHFRPYIPDGLREPPRLGAHWKPRSGLELNLESYFAITSTSVQTGFSGHLEAGTSWGGVRADASFDFIVMWEPSEYFELDLALRVTIFLFGCDLISAGLRGSLSGPSPWHLEGTVYWELCGVDLSKDVGPYEWGDNRDATSTVQQARQVLGDAFELPESWSMRRGTRLPVRLRPGSEDAIDPRDQIEVRQSVLPLGTDIEVNDRNTLSDPGTWTLTPTTATLAKLADLTDVFPMQRFRRTPPKETPFQSGLISGARFGGTGWDARNALAVSSDEEQTEDLVLDSLPAAAPPRRIKVPVRVLLDDAIRMSAPATALDRKWTRHAVVLEVVG
jgi:hypothetical protein